jgi:branched-chain amino acid transport system permease protein
MKLLKGRRLMWGILCLFLLLLPRLFSETQTYLATEVLIYALFAVGFNLLFGYTGLLPFGFAGLFGVGAYATALISNHYSGIPLIVMILIAALAGLVAAIVIGFFCVRLSGAYFSLTTVAFQMFLFAVALKWRSLTNGDDGMGVSRPELYLPGLASISLKNTANFYYFTLVVVVAAILICYVFLKTPLGNSLICVRERDVRASFLGYNVFGIRLIAFSGSGILAGIAGGLFVIFQEFVATTCMDMNMAMLPVLMTVIGGSGFFVGPIAGAAFYVVLQDWLSSLTSYWMIIMGVIFIIIVLYAEGGLIGLFKAHKMGRISYLGKKIDDNNIEHPESK